MPSTPSTTNKQPSAMPEGLNPDTLDVLTELAELLNRLRTPSGGSTSGATPAATSTPSQSQSHAHPPAPPPPRSTVTNNGTTTTANAGDLSLRDIAPAADVLKHRFQKARGLVLGLPDVGRGLPEQEAEIAALEAKIQRQRDMLLRLRDMGSRLAQEDGDHMAVD
ncbi:RNA polymerase II transcription mediator complex subunit 9-domain-containing protein [Hypoxylon fuscum]|nr:RNA polymerase II transcription mediator complex subunit 9-domain-containing protein [Hypoxylon fuscum]